ncbi:MAG: tripartite tricarboxylate transporter substrate binding protein [Burkholderiales bacterium]|nr:tripartite tricarboxylate transporter substrate binding protein [Burkholderiales bacterium]MDE1927508.1 tripartite tricarboxylate transporter substrate binding protein [Burkholderiales bacterium]MDE2158654.1 tripartite tricarboxylate transporter substrate binding protein [Burkholderiales bacterium]MDE2501809.1 tripartite tricarboxylate transporter substrate binding protein [Burkholderiales bacterium]
MNHAHPKRRTLVALAALGALAAAGWSAPARAGAWPAKPIRLLVGYSAGGAVDIIARDLAQQLQATLGQSVIVEDRPGAGTNIANRNLIESAPDGTTLMLVANAIAANPTLYQPAPFDPARDLTPVALVGRVPVVLAVPAESKLQTLAQMVAQARAEPGKVTYGTPGNGSTPHLAVALFEHAAGIRLTEVPYKGGAQALTDALGGRIDLVALNALEVLPQARSGKLRVLAVLTPSRSTIFPDVPTIAESGYPGFEASVWYGVVGPAHLPPAIVARLHEAVEQALATPALRQRLAGAGGEVLPGPTQRFADLLASEQARYAKLIRSAGIRPE